MYNDLTELESEKNELNHQIKSIYKKTFKQTFWVILIPIFGLFLFPILLNKKLHNGPVFSKLTDFKTKLINLEFNEIKIKKELNKIIEIKAIVQDGKQLGRTIGYPTCNLHLKEDIPKKLGVYVCSVIVDNQVYQGMGCYLGQQNDYFLFEVNIFNFNKKIYGQEIIVKIADFIRDNVKIKNIKQLKKLLKKDRKATLKILNEGKNK